MTTEGPTELKTYLPSAAAVAGAHVQGIDYEGTTSAWYHTVAVPEPGTTAMFLSGLVVLGAAKLGKTRLIDNLEV